MMPELKLVSLVVIALTNTLVCAQLVSAEELPASQEAQSLESTGLLVEVNAETPPDVSDDTAVKIASDTPETGFRLESKPRWEAGVGGAYVDGFDYPASNNPNRRGVALPFVIYRGSRFRFAGRGFSAVAVEKSNLKLDVSLSASLNAESEGNSLRESMPDLDFLIEFGPQLILRLVDRPLGNGRIKVNWSNRARAVFSTDFSSIDSRGWVLQTQLQMVLRKYFHRNVDALGFVNVSWAGEKLHDYFYQVDPEFETPVRQQYNAEGGYLGSNLFLGMAVRAHPRLRIFGGIRVGYFAGAANEDSPLFETDSNLGVALGFAWTAYRSKEKILVLEED